MDIINNQHTFYPLGETESKDNVIKKLAERAKADDAEVTIVGTITDKGVPEEYSHNPYAIPFGVDGMSWAETLTVLFGDIYGLMDKGRELYKEAILECYKKESYKSDAVGQYDIYRYIKDKSVSNDKDAESYSRLACRLEAYNNIKFLTDAYAVQLFEHTHGADAKKFLCGSVVAAKFATLMAKQSEKKKNVTFILDSAETILCESKIYDMIYALAAGVGMTICSVVKDSHKLPKFVINNSKAIIL